MFKKVLIANRGEIACRVIRTLKKMNITAVAVYSEADQFAEHVKQADEAYCLGAAVAKESYLNIAKIIAVAKKCGVEAIHPGYGFLSENADFAQACTDANIIFIGPPVAAINAMGSKAAAKALMAQHQVPILQGYHGDSQEESFLLSQAEKIGFPVLIKASAGGGGRGMRVVHAAKEFKEELAAAKREALSGFGNDHVIIEKYLAAPRHVEVQIFADQAQNYVYLFERDCSIQRRNQKVIEEAPAPGLSEETRKAIGEAAVKAAQAVQYVGAGTVEFLMDADQKFYFMEMNTRLQVEHPVTEMITGEDLVNWQLQVAVGLPLPKQQSELKIQGAAIEARICAEDPLNNFLPATGKITYFDYPHHQTGLRVDTGFTAGGEISIYYDSLLCKMIAYGSDRDAARRNLAEGLAKTAIYGVKTNVDLLHRIVTHQDFAQEKLSTHFIAQQEQALLVVDNKVPGEVIVAVALSHLQKKSLHDADPWHQLLLWGKGRQAQLQFKVGAAIYDVEVAKVASGWQVKVNHAEEDIFYNIHAVHQHDSMIEVVIEDAAYKMFVSCWQNLYLVNFGEAQRYHLELLSRFGEVEQDVSADSKLISPMPGRIVSQMVQVGDNVQDGQILMVMEAMKMEHSIRAPYAGMITELLCQVGDVVPEGKKLVELE